MSMAEPLIPHPDRDVEDVRDDRELQLGPLDGPDILGGPPESRLEEGVESVSGVAEPDAPAPDLSRKLPIRKPAVGEQLTPEQLEHDLDA